MKPLRCTILLSQSVTEIGKDLKLKPQQQHQQMRELKLLSVAKLEVGIRALPLNSSIFPRSELEQFKTAAASLL